MPGALLLIAMVVPRMRAQVTPQSTAPAMSVAERQVVDAERALWDLLVKKEWNAFGQVTDGMTYVDMNGIVPSMKTSDMVEGLNGLETKSYELSDVRARTIAPNIVILTYKGSIDQTMNGQHVPSPIYMMSVWQKKGDKWVAVAHQETNAADAK